LQIQSQIASPLAVHDIRKCSNNFEQVGIESAVKRYNQESEEVNQITDSRKGQSDVDVSSSLSLLQRPNRFSTCDNISYITIGLAKSFSMYRSPIKAKIAILALPTVRKLQMASTCNKISKMFWLNINKKLRKYCYVYWSHSGEL
jgi:hypothetical protein